MASTKIITRIPPYRCRRFWPRLLLGLAWLPVGALAFAIMTDLAALTLTDEGIFTGWLIPENNACNSESNAIASLKAYASAQAIYRKGNYAAVNGLPPGSYAPSFVFLGGARAHRDASGRPLQLLPRDMADAVGQNSEYNGYYFIDASNCGPGGFALFAVPCLYERTGINTYFINAAGKVYMKDLAGQLPDLTMTAADSTWLVP